VTTIVTMNIPTEPLGSIPRPMPLIEAIAELGDHSDPALDSLHEEAIRDTIEEFEATGSPRHQRWRAA
jgi:5-methyltetrahydropteroyltriglutamate--homocysteine methyltransferase